jgi:hypothetical protein
MSSYSTVDRFRRAATTLLAEEDARARFPSGSVGTIKEVKIVDPATMRETHTLIGDLKLNGTPGIVAGHTREGHLVLNVNVQRKDLRLVTITVKQDEFVLDS